MGDSTLISSFGRCLSTGTNIGATCAAFHAPHALLSFGHESNVDSLIWCPVRPTLYSMAVLDEIADKLHPKLHGLFFLELVQRLRQQFGNNSSF